jgi:KaiC/GvpD/RAD55 family RecA-like ATPase
LTLKKSRIAIPILAFILLLAPAIIPRVFASTYSFQPTPARTTETSVGSIGAIVLILNVSQANVGTNYQFTWVVTDPSGGQKNQHNATAAPSSSFLISLQYPRDFGTSMIFAGNYTVTISQTQPSNIPNVATGHFTIGLTDKPIYQRTNTVVIKAAGYGNGESVSINIYRGMSSNSAPNYPTTIFADSGGQVFTSWTIPLNIPTGIWTVALTGASTSKAVSDTQTFTVNPINVLVSALNLGQAIIQRTQTQSVSFTANYQGGPAVQTGSSKVRLTESDGVTSHIQTALYNSSYAAYLATYTIPPSSRTGGWVAAVDPGMFDDGYGNTGPGSSVVQPFSVYPTNVTITQLTLAQMVIQRTLSQSFSLRATYATNSIPVQTGSANIRITESDGTTSFVTRANYNSSIGLYQATVKIASSAQTGVWVASIDPSSFNDGYGNGGPLTSVVRGFTVQPATFTILLSVPNQTFTLGQVMPIYATITYPDGSAFTSGNANVTFALSGKGNQTGTPVSLTYVQGQSRWAGSYIVKATDLPGLWVATLRVSDTYGNSGEQTLSMVVTVPPPFGTNSPSLNLYWFIVAALIAGSSGSGLVLLRRFNVSRGPFEHLFNLMGGDFSPPMTLMILGEAGSGTTTLSLELIYRQLSSGKRGGLLAYDAFPSEIRRNMKSLGWDVDGYLKDGSFKILDCYSALAGVESSVIRDPVDFTEISIRVTGMMAQAGNGPYMLVLDSIAPIFNGVKAETTINFLRVLSAKIKSGNGILVLTGAKASVPEQVRPSLDSIVDGVIELDISRAGNRIMRTLTVKRIAGRKTSPVPVEFEIATGKGIVFKKPRIPLRILTPKSKTRQF